MYKLAELQINMLAQSSGGNNVLFYVLMLAGVLVLGFVFFRQYQLTKNSSGKGRFDSNNRSSSSTTSTKSVSSSGPTTSEQEELKEEFESILYELRDFVSESMAKLDTKVRYLNQLIMEADEKIEELKQAKNEHDDPNRPTPSQNPNPTPSGNPSSQQAPPDTTNAVDRTVPPGEPSAGAPSEQSTEQSTNEPDQPDDFTELQESVSREDEPIQNKPMYQWVWRLADRGLDRSELAEKTGLEEAEIDMILGMREVQENQEDTE